ncbi:MAG: alpha/beta fold hydrolase [Candidatus Korobacteraceae bacterium]
MTSGEFSSPQFVLPPLPELRSTSVFGQTIRYYDVGAGPALVLLHGIGGDADDWAFCLDALSQSQRVIALDLLGFGRSGKPYINYSIAGFVEVVQQFLQALGTERASLMGNSLGGWIATSFALQFPAIVDKLVLVDAAGLWGSTVALPIDLRLSTRHHLREAFEFLFHDKSLVTDDLVDLAYRQHLERGDGYTIHNLLQHLPDGREWLDRNIAVLEVPTLIVWGEQDAMIPVETGRQFHRQIPNSRLEIISKCGHLPALEQPAELLRLVLNFLAS